MTSKSHIRVPPDSTGKKIYTLEHGVQGDTVQGQVVHIADPEHSSHIQHIDPRGASMVTFSEGQPILGGFGGLKTTEQRKIGVYEHTLNHYNSLFFIDTANGGESILDHAASSVILRTSGDADSRVVRTTNRYHYYVPGSANVLTVTTACGDSGKAGNIRRWGLYDDRNGLFFELNGTQLNVVIRSSTTGSITEVRIPQSEWNCDRADGTSISEVNLDITKVQVWWIDYQWLGGGRVRFGIFEPNGARLVLHEQHHANSIVVPYMGTGTLPFRTENFNTTATGSVSELREICAAVYTEGSIDDYTFWNFETGVYEQTVDQPFTMLAGYRVSTTLYGKHNTVQVYPETINIFAAEPLAISVWLGAEVTDGEWIVPDNTYNVLELTTTGSLDRTNAIRFKTVFVNPGCSQIVLKDYFRPNDEGVFVRADGSQPVMAITASRLENTENGSPLSVKFNATFKGLW